MQHRRQWNTWLLIALLLVLLGAVASLAWQRVERQREQQAAEALRERLPVATSMENGEERGESEQSEQAAKPESTADSSHLSPLASNDSVPGELSLAVPFTSQAPHANWDHDHEEFCEEAAALMVGRFFQGRGVDSPDDAEAALQELKRWQVEHLGYFESTTADEVARMVREVYGLTVELVVISSEARNPDGISHVVRDDGELLITLKRALADSKLVIVPAAGRELRNPYFKQPGPLYHMLVVKGYTKAGTIITNDPGTKRGENYVYTWDRLYEAMGDWNNGDPAHGGKVVLVVSR